MILRLKKIIISTQIGRALDVLIRVLFSLIPLLHITISRKKVSKPDSFVFFLYGGIGDVVLTLPLVNKIALHGNTFVLCDKRIYTLKFLFSNSVNFVLYEKENLLLQSKKLRKQIIGLNPVFIQTSPIIECYFVSRLLKIPRSVGLILKFNQIHYLGFNSKYSQVNSINKIVIYNEIYKKIKHQFGFNEITQKHSHFFNKVPLFFFERLKGRYLVISPMKSAQWEMGKMSSIGYAKTADFFAKNYNYNVVFVGSKSEANIIDQIISLTSHQNMIINMAGKTSLKELSSLLYYSNFVISNDNGIAHLTAFLNIKLLVLFMFSDPEVYSWNSGNYEYIINKIKKCMPCVSMDKYPRDNYPVLCRNNLVCNKSITSELIVQKIRSLEWV